MVMVSSTIYCRNRTVWHTSTPGVIIKLSTVGKTRGRYKPSLSFSGKKHDTSMQTRSLGKIAIVLTLYSNPSFSISSFRLWLSYTQLETIVVWTGKNNKSTFPLHPVMYRRCTVGPLLFDNLETPLSSHGRGK